MLSRQYRLPANTRLKNTFFYRSKLFTVKFTKNDLPHCRFGFIVKKTKVRQAVTRNRIRRVFRSCIEDILKQLKEGYDMLFFLEGSIIDKDRETLCREINIFFNEKRLIESGTEIKNHKVKIPDKD